MFEDVIVPPAELELCKKAILIYLAAKFEFSKIEQTPNLNKSHEDTAEHDAKFLASWGSEGLRLGAPGWGDCKLRYAVRWPDEKKRFYINDNGMNKRQFQRWQKFVGKKFEANGLGFYYFK